MLTLETPRLLLRPLTLDDEPALAAVISDPETMRWYPRPYTAEEVRGWIERQMGRYRDGAGLLGIVEKQSGRLIGDCGPAWQDLEGQMELEVGYHVNRECWNQGFATEAARAVIEDVFRRFPVDRLISLIRPENLPSRRVAEKNGLTLNRVVFWHGYDHCIYERTRSR
ncbi:MAG TPA: GNAT family N-acetyltransferase [Silvibacterium sp.]|nr:GNAT family N-acetyltransferase [Silvibacterium sp.]